MAGAREASCFGGPKTTFLVQVQEIVQISWHVQYFGHDGGLRRALISWQVHLDVIFANALAASPLAGLRDANFEVQTSWQAQ